MVHTVYLKVMVIVDLDPKDTVDNFVQEMDYNFVYAPKGVNRVVNTEIVDHEE